MNRLPRILLALPVAALALGTVACSSSDDKAASDTTVTTETTAPASTSTSAASGGGSGSSTTTAAPADACAKVTDAEVKAGRPDLTITTWQCATDSEDRAWVGGVGEAGGGAADVNFIMVQGSDGAFTEATDAEMAACAAPIPEALRQYCETN